MTEVWDEYAPEIVMVSGILFILIGALLPELPGIWTATGIAVATMGTMAAGVGIGLRVYSIRKEIAGETEATQ